MRREREEREGKWRKEKGKGGKRREREEREGKGKKENGKGEKKAVSSEGEREKRPGREEWGG